MNARCEYRTHVMFEFEIYALGVHRGDDEGSKSRTRAAAMSWYAMLKV